MKEKEWETAQGGKHWLHEIKWKFFLFLKLKLTLYALSKKFWVSILLDFPLWDKHNSPKSFFFFNSPLSI